MDTHNRTGMIRRAAMAGALAPIVFAVGVITVATQFDGYSHVTQKISELGGPDAPMPWLQSLNFLALGTLTLALVWALSKVLGPPHRGALLLGYFGVVALVHSVLPCDAGCAGQTTVGLLHNVTGLTAFLAAIASMVILGRRWQNDPTWHRHAEFTRVIRTVAIIGLAWFVITQAADAQSTAGIAQRVFAGALVLWIGATGWRLRGILASPAEPSPLKSPEAARDPLSV